MPQSLGQGPTVYNGHLRGPVTLKPVADRLTMELLLFYNMAVLTEFCRTL